LGDDSASQAFPRNPRPHVRTASSEAARRKSARARMPSSAGYLIVVVTIAIVLFFALWWASVSGGDEAPWVMAGLVASAFLLIAFSAREVLMRRAWTRYLLEQDQLENASRERSSKSSSTNKAHFSSMHAAALRALQKQSSEADSSNGPADLHLDVFHACQDYLANTDEALRSSRLSAESRVALRASQEKARILQRHHMLTWARDASRALTHEAQQRGRLSDKIETANRAMDCLDTALKAYPDEPELEESKLAIREFVASVKVAHWVELAERSAFKGHLRRAIERYQDALFYLSRETVKEEVRLAGSDRIVREIELLRARLNSSKPGGPTEPKPPAIDPT
jgi:tetratricopeptide (TPR) repeat protein